MTLPSRFIRRWGPLLPILALALIVRIGYAPGVGMEADLSAYSGWIDKIARDGLLHFYQNQTERTYPAFDTTLLGILTAVDMRSGPVNFAVREDPGLVESIKFFPILSELLLIVVVYAWLRDRKILRWLVPGALALNPGLIITSAWWGQNDAIFTLLIVLVLLALNRDKPLLAWALFGLAVMSKQQAAVLAPLVLVLSYRRYGWRITILGGIVAGIICGAILTPYALVSGLGSTLAPYLNATDHFPATSVSGLTAWYAIFPVAPFDSTRVIGPITYKLIGEGVFGLYCLLIMAMMWRHSEQKREFVWAAALYFGVFMLPTQIHERYLYPAAVLILIAVVQDRRLWPVALLTAFTYTYNLLQVADPLPVYGVLLHPVGISREVAVINIGLLAVITAAAIYPLRLHLTRYVFGALRVGLAAVIVLAFLKLLAPQIMELRTADWLSVHVADYSRLAADRSAAEVTHLTSPTWNWQIWPNVENRSISDWLVQQGVNYLLIDDRTPDTEKKAEYDQRLQTLSSNGATVIYESTDPLHIAPHEAVLWTFRPDYPLNVVFDGKLDLVGYHVLHDDGKVSLLFHWYTLQTPAALNLYLHIVDAATGALLGQADTALGGITHSSDTWRKNEIVFQTVELPADVLAKTSSPYHLEIGLYQLDGGTRATITDGNGKLIGDHLDLTIP